MAEMGLGREIAMWAERIGAGILALVALAVVWPNLASMDQLARRGRIPQGGYLWAGVAYTVVAVVLVGMIIAGQQRSRTLRITGWVLLLAFCVFSCR